MSKSSQRLENKLVSRLKLRQLRLIIAISEHQNIVRASRQLNIAQPAATKMLHDIEDMIGVALFERYPRGVMLNDYGKVFVKHIKLILAGVRHASEEITSLQEGVSGHIHVGTLLAASSFLLPKGLALLKKDRPNLLVTVQEGTHELLLSSLLVGDIDIVVGRLEEHSASDKFDLHTLYYEPVTIVARKGHRLAQRKELSLKDLSKEHWILPLRDTLLRAQIEDAFKEEDLPTPPVDIESVSLLTNLMLLSSSELLAVLPLGVGEIYRDLGLLSLLASPINIGPGPVGIMTRKGADLSPAVKLFIDCLRYAAEGH